VLAQRHLLFRDCRNRVSVMRLLAKRYNVAISNSGNVNHIGCQCRAEFATQLVPVINGVRH